MAKITFIPKFASIPNFTLIGQVVPFSRGHLGAVSTSTFDPLATPTPASERTTLTLRSFRKSGHVRH